MKPTLAIIAAALLLAGCQNPDPRAYHHAAAHPFQVKETSTSLPLQDLAADAAVERATLFAADRPNNGSSFIVAAPQQIGEAVVTALMRTGVPRHDIRLIPDGAPAKIVRTDRLGSVAGCTPAPRDLTQEEYIWEIDSGYGRDNSNGVMFGCAVRGNIARMVDDPRSLTGPRPMGGRDGSRAAVVYDRWVKGEHTGSNAQLSNDGTTTSVLAGGASE